MPDPVPPAAPAAAAPPVTPPAAPPAAPPPAAPPAAPENPFAELEAAVKKVDADRGIKPPPAAPGPQGAQAPGPQGAQAPQAPGAQGKAPRPADLLRNELEKWKTEASSKSEQLTRLESRIKELESKGANTEVLQARATELEKELDAARGEIRAIRQEASPEFIKQYKAPFDEAAAYAKYVIEQFQVTNPETGETRKANFDDLQSLYAMPINKASAVARNMFGDDAPTVINHLNELHRLNYTYQKALEQERQNAQARAKEEAGKAAAQRSQLEGLFNQVTKELGESVAEYHDKPDDAESATLRTKGYSIFDAKPANQEQAIMKRAHIRHMVAAHYPLKLQVQRLAAENEQLKAEIEKMKGPLPGDTKRKETAPAAGAGDGLSWEQAARKELA